MALGSAVVLPLTPIFLGPIKDEDPTTNLLLGV